MTEKRLGAYRHTLHEMAIRTCRQCRPCHHQAAVDDIPFQRGMIQATACTHFTSTRSFSR